MLLYRYVSSEMCHSCRMPIFSKIVKLRLFFYIFSSFVNTRQLHIF